MDPLSIAVSTISITGAVWTTGKGIAALRKFRDGPKDLARLLRETDDLHKVLLQICSVVDDFQLEPASRENPYRCWTVEWIKEQIKEADEAMIELDRLGHLCSTRSNSGELVCSKWEWQKNRTKATTLLSHVQAIRGKLLSGLTILNLWVQLIVSTFSGCRRTPSAADGIRDLS